MHNLIEYSKNYSKTFGALWSYYKDILTDPITNSEYKTSITGKTAIDGNKKEVFDFFVPLKHLRNFWRTLDLPLTNCEVCLTLTQPKNCVITGETTRDADLNANPLVLEIRAPKEQHLK